MKRQTVHFCDGCGKMFDELQPEGGQAQWVEARVYLMKYGLRWDDIERLGDSCPECARVFQAAAHQGSSVEHDRRPS